MQAADLSGIARETSDNKKKRVLRETEISSRGLYVKTVVCSIYTSVGQLHLPRRIFAHHEKRRLQHGLGD